MFIGNAGGDFGETIIRARDADVIIAGGMEVCQMHRLPKKRSLWIRIGSDSVFDLMVNNEIKSLFSNDSMPSGEQSSNVV
ncbi:hypothetical protein [Desulfosporosinus meridiei]|uniref:hypothetical protein n=1 Tax=Desulfosporosinus meridiei TaxID=79209 RepID=UPI00023146A1|nr:hypothetical protein [Desulfosporosinus meridiei]